MLANLAPTVNALVLYLQKTVTKKTPTKKPKANKKTPTKKPKSAKKATAPKAKKTTATKKVNAFPLSCTLYDTNFDTDIGASSKRSYLEPVH